MHRLDVRINDIEPRLLDICAEASKFEQVSLQESVVSYAWILLDSWISWRTTRFLLRRTVIDDRVNEKWFQTPSSYRAAQLLPIWLFDDVALNYIEDRTNKSFSELINKVIQENRNAAAHFSANRNIKGSDFIFIENTFRCLSHVFYFYELFSFITDIEPFFVKLHFEDMRIFYSKSECCMIADMRSHVAEMTSDIELLLGRYKDSICSIRFSDRGCFVGKGNDYDNLEYTEVVGDGGQCYPFSKCKGYYLNCDSFCRSVVRVLDK